MTPADERVAGIDGCRAGWIGVSRCGPGAVQAWLAADVASLLALLQAEQPEPALVLIDMPIGLPERGRRQCDHLARQLLAQRRSSVFPAPIRPMLAAASWEEACAIGSALENRRLSRQAWNLMAKVRQVDELLQRQPPWRGRLREVHPELSFRAMAGAPLSHAKKTSAGRQQRLQLINETFGSEVFEGLRRQFRRSAVADDDLLDALAALWSAERVLRGEGLRLPDDPEPDSTGLVMEILS